MRRAILSAIFLFLLGASFRVPYLDHNDIHVDEHHWVQSSNLLLQRIISDPTIATNHLGQPGIVPAIVMAVGQGVLNFVATIREVPPNPLYASRLSCALVSSLIPPILFLGALIYFPFRISLLAGIFLALDPSNIGFSRMAHLDTVQSLLTLSCVFLYALGVERNFVPLKLLSGVFWGLASITKPTSAFLIPAFILWKAIRRRYAYDDRGSERSIISWSDLGTAFTGFAVMAVFYTRFWVHNSDYLWRLKIQSALADAIYSAGLWLQSAPVIPALLVIFIVTMFKLTSNGLSENLRHHLKSLAISFSLLTITLTLFPQVFENQIRFWSWAFGLKEAQHAAHGVVQTSAAVSYLTLFLVRNQEIFILAILAGAFGIWPSLKKRETSNQELFVLLCILASVIWLCGLSASTKRTWRYAMPILPLLSIVASYGVTRIGAFVALISPPLRARTISFLMVIVPGALFAGTIVFAPHFELFFNPTSGGVKKWISKTKTISTVGQDDALDFLMEIARSRKKTIYVSALVGDKDVLSYALFRKYGRDSKFVSFGYFKPQVADFVLAQPKINEEGVFNVDWDWLKSESPIFYGFFRGLALLHIYEVPFVEFNEPDVRVAKTLHHRTGKLDNVRGVDGKVLIAKPKSQMAGYLAFNEGYRVTKGKYEVIARTWGLMRPPVWSSLDRESEVLSLELLPFCGKDFKVKDLSIEPLSLISLRCEVDQEARVEPRVTWYGTIPIALKDITFRKVE